VAQRFDRLLQRAALRQQQADAAIAAQVAGRREHQVAQARKAHEGLGASAQRDARARHFGQAARDERRARIEPKREAVAQAGGDRQHVLHRAADFDAGEVVVGIDAHRRSVEGRDQCVAHAAIRWRPPARWAGRARLLGKAGAAEHAAGQVRRDLGADLVSEQAGRRRLEALAQPGDRRPTLPRSAVSSSRRPAMGVATITSSWRRPGPRVARCPGRRPTGRAADGRAGICGSRRRPRSPRPAPHRAPTA
jgi:hypothetical protein